MLPTRPRPPSWRGRLFWAYASIPFSTTPDGTTGARAMSGSYRRRTTMASARSSSRCDVRSRKRRRPWWRQAAARRSDIRPFGVGGWSMSEPVSIGSVIPIRNPSSRNVPAVGETAAHLASPRAFLTHHIVMWRWHFAALATTVILAASCAVLVQYAMKLLVDTMSGPPERAGGIWAVLGIFIGLIAFESLFWRLSGWLGCRTTVNLGVQMRLELFAYLNSQPMRFFAERLAGSLGQRITSTAGNFGALVNTVVWRIAPPAVDFVGAMIVFATVSWHMGAVLAILVLVFTSGLIIFGERGRPLHSAYAASSSTVGGDLIDVISNMWAVKAFSARHRERERLERRFREEADIQRASWMYTEKTRIAYDVVLWLMAGSMLAWAVHLWSARAITTGDVVVVS